MNKDRRAQIQKVRDTLADLKGQIEALQQEEQEYADNVPENMQGNDRHVLAEAAAEALQEAADACDEVDGHLETATE